METNFLPQDSSHQLRRYDLDWLRVIAFAILIFFHVGMFFNHWGWHIKNNDITSAVEWPMRFSSQWRMALLFMISGAGVYFALGSRSAGAFMKERFVRILVPLLFGMFVIVPPQIFFERLTQGHTYSYSEFYKTVFEFQAYPDGSFSWHHLWYLAYIFFYSLLGLPLLLFLRRNHKLTEKIANAFKSPFLLIAIPVIWHVTGSAFLAEKFPTTHNLVRDWNEHFHDFTLFVTGFVFCTQVAFWETMRKYRKLTLSIWVTLTFILYAFYWTSDRDVEGAERLLYEIIKTVNAWCILLSFFGFGYTYLRFTNSFLKYANEAVYPFYILHQTVIIVLAYPLIDSPSHWLAKFAYLCIATFSICLALYHFLIRRFGVLRIVFGLKLNKSKKRSETAAPISSIS